MNSSDYPNPVVAKPGEEMAPRNSTNVTPEEVHAMISDLNDPTVDTIANTNAHRGHLIIGQLHGTIRREADILGMAYTQIERNNGTDEASIELAVNAMKAMFCLGFRAAREFPDLALPDTQPLTTHNHAKL